MLYKMFFNQSPDIMLIFRGSDGSIVDANEAAMTAFGCKHEELLKKNFYSLHFSEDIFSIASGMNETAPSRIIETTHRRKGTAGFPLIVSLRYVMVNDEKIFFCTLIEITANKRIGEQIKKDREQLEEMVETRTAKLRMSNIQLQKEIKERKQVEETLRHSETRLYHITDNMLDMICQTDKEGVYQYASPSHKNVLGYESDYLPGKSVFTFVHPDDLKTVLAAVEEAIETKTPGKLEYRYRHADGHYLWLETTGSLLFDDSGQISGAIFSSRDITTRKIAEEELHSERQKFESLLERAPFGIVLFDNTLRLKYFNPKFKELFGYDLDEIPSGRNWVRKAFPGFAYRHSIVENWLNDLRAVEPGQKRPRIYTVTCKDGTQKTVGFVAVQLKSGEHLLTCEDITQRRWVEIELHKQALFLQRLIDNIPSPVFYKDVNGIYQGCNKAFEAFLGWNKKDIVGKSVYDLSPMDLADEYHKMDEELFREQGVQVYESSVLYADGARHSVIFNKAAYFNTDGTLAGLVGVISDIEERKKAEEEIRQSEALLRSIVESPQNIMTFSLDKNYRYLFFNKAHYYTMKNIWGADIKLGKSMLEYITYPEDRERAAANFDRTLSGENFSVIEEYGDEKLNRKFWDDIYNPIVIDTGEIIGLTVFCSDITERIQAEEKLRAANQQLMDIIDFLPDATFVIDRDGRVIAWNHVIEELTGVKKEDILGKGDYSYAVPFHGEPRPIFIDLIFEDESMVKQHYDYVRREGNTFYGETFAQSAYMGKGAYLWVKASPLFDKGGDIVGAIQSIRDITGLKHLEERFRVTGRELQLALEKLGERELIDRIIETSPAGILVVNNGLKITFANARAEQLLGLKIKGKNRHAYKMPNWFYTDYQGNPIPDEELVYNQVISTGLQVFDVAQAIQWPDGTMTLLSINGAPLYDRSGAIEGAVLSIEDVTLRREAEQKINSYQKQLRSLAAQLALVEERERRRIAEGIHDHIGQALAVARLKIGALKKVVSPEAAIIKLDEINALIEEAIKNTRSLTFELSPPILYDLGFGAAVEWLGEQLLEKNGIRFNLINKLKPKSLDEELRIILFTAVRELFFNIIKHAGAKKVHISVQKLGDKILVEVEDDGTGFNTTLIGPEYRKNDGFGLFSINERLEHLGGRLEIISKPGHGTRITIEAPLTNSH